jgi:hypothetical protein
MTDDHDSDDHDGPVDEVALLLPALLQEMINRTGACHGCTLRRAASVLIGTYIYATNYSEERLVERGFFEVMRKDAVRFSQILTESEGMLPTMIPAGLRPLVTIEEVEAVIPSILDALLKSIVANSDELQKGLETQEDERRENS